MLLDLVTEVLFGIRRNRLTVDEFLWTVLLDKKMNNPDPGQKHQNWGCRLLLPE